MNLPPVKNLFQGWLRRALGLPEAWFDRVTPQDGGSGLPTVLPQPYADSVWVMRAIKKVASPITAVPLEFYRTGEDESEVEDPALAAFWRKPANGLLLPDFVEATVAWLKLNGECFWLMGDGVLRPFPEVAAAFEPLLLARPDKMQPVKSKDGLEGWVFTDESGQCHTLLPEQVVQLKFFNPYDSVRGLAEYRAARIAAETDYSAGQFGRNLMLNNGDTGPIISNKTGMLTDVQQQQIISQLRMKRDLAQRGEYRAAFLTSDVTVQQATAQTVDADFAAMRLGNRHEIFLAFGVPPSMADKMESYSVGSASDWYILLFETCIPTAQKIAAAISEVIKRQTGQVIEACFEFDEHPVMQKVRAERLESAEKLWSKGMPLDAVSDYLNLGLPEFPGSEVGYLPFSVSPVGAPDVQDPTTDPDLEEAPPSDTPIAEMFRALRAGSLVASVPESPDPFQRSRPASEVASWKAHEMKRRPIVRAYQAHFNRVLMAARADVLQKLEAHSALRTPPSALQQRAAADFLFNLDGFNATMQAVMRNAARVALQTAGEQLFEEIGGQRDPWKTPPAEVVAFVQNRENKLSGIGDEIWTRIRDKIEEGINNGDSLNIVANAIRAEFNDISKGRAKTIALTETSAAYGYGRDLAMKASGVQFKKWLTSGNSNVRPAHRDANGQIVPVDEPFIVDGEELDFPGDPSGEPGNVINCHCVSIAVASGPEDPNE